MITALLVATRNTIRSALSLSADQCFVQDDGMPPPTAGPLFIAVHGASWKPGTIDQNQGIDEYGTITVTITRRFSAVAFDVRGQEIYVSQSLDVDNMANTIKLNVHQNYALINAANSMLTGTNKIMEPFRWLGGDAQPRRVDNSWFSSDDPNQYAGLTLSLQFGQARRMQTLANIR